MAGSNCPRMLHNMMASRETELVETYPVQVVTRWFGNTPSVALRHYLMTTDEHFDAAVRGDGQTAKSTEEKTAQNPAQSVHAGSRFDSHANMQAHKKPRTCRGFAGSCV